jgi:acetoacetyl-CoA synthetase
MIDQPIPAPAMVDLLTSIWERVLERQPIGADDNFFDIGGDPASVNRLFAEIARNCGRELSPLTIYQAPTIAALSAVLEEPAPPRLSTLVRLKTGTRAQPIYMIPGMGGTVMEFFQLVKHLDSDHPIYGLQSRGMDGVEQPFECIEDLAQFHLDAIRALQPRGPYILVGYSLGGLVALEMAQRLSDSGEAIALFVMIETYVSRSYIARGKQVVLARRRTSRFVRKLLRRAGFQLRTPENVGAGVLDRPDVGQKLTSVMLRACDIADLTWRRYRPKHYKGRITFLGSAERDPEYADDPASDWGKVSDDFVAETVPGNHFDILTTHSQSVGAAISRYLMDLPR